jgi:hypothetical protein
MVDDKERQKRQKLVSFLQEHPKTFFSPKTISKKTGLRQKFIVREAHKSDKIRLVRPYEVGSLKHDVQSLKHKKNSLKLTLTLLTLH